MFFLVGIAGGSGSGKTTFAKKIIKNLSHSQGLSILHLDAYYHHELPKESYLHNGRPNYDHPLAFDWELLLEHLKNLKMGIPINVPKYDFKTGLRSTDFESMGPCKVVLFEGIFSLFNEDIRNILDIKCFLHVDADIRFTRRLHRDVQERGRSLESVIEQYYESVRPMYQKYLDPQRQYADFTVGEETDIAALILSSKIKDYLS